MFVFVLLECNNIEKGTEFGHGMMGDVEFPHPLDYIDKNGNATYMKDESFYLNMDEGRSIKV